MTLYYYINQIAREYGKDTLAQWVRESLEQDTPRTSTLSLQINDYLKIRYNLRRKLRSHSKSELQADGGSRVSADSLGISNRANK